MVVVCLFKYKMENSIFVKEISTVLEVYSPSVPFGWDLFSTKSPLSPFALAEPLPFVFNRLTFEKIASVLLKQ